MAKKPSTKARPSDSDELWRQVESKIASGRKPKPPKPHPDLDDQILHGVHGKFAEMHAEIQREWERYFAQPFPGWSREALIVVSGLAGLPLSAWNDKSSIVIYRTAIEKKKPVPKQTSTFVPNKFQRSILSALDGRALNKQQLADKVCGSDGSRLYNSRTRKGDLNELLDLGLVQNKPRLGYYRPDAPPAD